MKPKKSGKNLPTNREVAATALLRRLFRDTFSGHLVRYLLAIGSMSVMAGSTAALAWLMKSAINDVFVDRNVTAMWVVAASIVTLAVVKGLADYSQTVLMAKIGNSIVATLQERIFDKMISLKIDYFNRSHSREMIAGVTNFSKGASNALTLTVTTFGRDMLTLLALGTVMFVQDPLLSLGAITIGPVVIYGVYKLVRKIKSISVSELTGLAEIVGTTQETFQGIRAVKSFTAENTMRAKFAKATRSLEGRMNAISRVKAATSPLMETLGGIVIASMVVYAGWQTISVGKTPGEFMSFVTAFLLAYEPAKRLANMRVGLQQNLVAVSRMYDFLDHNEPEPEKPGASELALVQGKIEFCNVTFGYEADKPVLDDVSLIIKPGEVVALVGMSGAGKSTLFSLLERFYEPWSGSIKVDDHDIGSVSLAALRQQISAVGQSTALFSGTVRNNIRLGRSGATDTEVEAAATAAQAHDFISALPKGYDTAIGERGINLSGGQVQRLAIARALLKDAPILLLDEATSALDTDTERQVREGLAKLMQGRTTFVIAHRLSTIIEADRIYVMDGGKVLASGCHRELLKSNSLYKRLFGDAVRPKKPSLEKPVTSLVRRHLIHPQ